MRSAGTAALCSVSENHRTKTSPKSASTDQVTRSACHADWVISWGQHGANEPDRLIQHVRMPVALLV